MERNALSDWEGPADWLVESPPALWGTGNGKSPPGRRRLDMASEFGVSDPCGHPASDFIGE